MHTCHSLDFCDVAIIQDAIYYYTTILPIYAGQDACGTKHCRFRQTLQLLLQVATTSSLDHIF